MSPAGWASVGLAAAAAGLLPAVPSRTACRPARPSRSVPSDRSLRWLAAVAVAVATATLVGHLAGLVLAPVAGVVAARWLAGLQTGAGRRRQQALARGLPLVVDLMAASLTVGASPGAALAKVATAVDPPMREELAAVAARLRLGVDPAAVWDDLARHPGLGPLGRSLGRAVRTGASVAEAMTRLAEDLRRTARAETEGRARAVGVKAAAPLGLCLLPAFVLVGVVPLVAGTVARFVAP